MNKHVKKALTGIGHVWLHILGFVLLALLVVGLVCGFLYALITHPIIVVITLVTLYGALEGLST